VAKRYEDLTPRERAAVDAVRARWRTPEYRAEEERVRDLVMAEFPPSRTAPPALAHALAELRAERERMGLSLADVAARSGLGRSALSRLENGLVPNPTLDTLDRYAAALGKRLALVVRDIEPVGS
jgi:DNA-binding phage protein